MDSFSRPAGQPAACAAAQVLLRLRISALPISLGDISKGLSIPCVSYQALAKRRNCGIAEVCAAMDSMSGSALKINGKYHVAYNGDMPVARKRFTVAHEIGHIVLGHLESAEVRRLSREALARAPGRAFEQEANDFARNLLAPPAAHEMQAVKNIAKTSAIFGISKACASVRLSALRRDLLCLRGAGLYARQKEQFQRCVCPPAEGDERTNRCANPDQNACGVLLDDGVLRCPYCGNATSAWWRRRAGRFCLDDLLPPKDLSMQEGLRWRSRGIRALNRL